MLPGSGHVEKLGDAAKSERPCDYCARQVLKELASIHSMDVVLQVKDSTQVRLRLVAKPDKLAADLLDHMQLKLPTRPKKVQNVVEKTGV